MMLLLNKIIKNYFLNSNLDSIKINKIIFYYCIFIFFTVIISIVFSYLFFKQFPTFFEVNSFKIIPSKLPFGYGNLLNNLFENGTYMNTENFLLVKGKEIITSYDIDFVLKKLPLFSLLLFYLISISKNIFFLIITKNILFFSLFFFVSYYSLKSLNMKIYQFLLIILFFLIIPYNLKTFSEISYADSISSILIACLYLLCISKIKFKSYLIGLALFFLYLTKESMFAICIFVPLLIIYFDFKNEKFNSLVPTLFIILSITAWGIYGVIKTDKFPFGQSISTWKSYDMSKSISEDFKKYYPKYSTDNLDSNRIDKKLNSEWEFYEYFKKKNIEKIKSEPNTIFENLLLKMKFLMFNLYPDGISYNKIISFDILFILTNIINKISIYLALSLSLLIMLSKKYNFGEIEKYFLIIFLLNISTHLVGWFTTKHLVGISLISFIFLVIRMPFIFSILNEKYKKNV